MVNEQPIITDILLDFLNRESREIYGVFANYKPQQHIDLITDALNVAVFLCYEHCIATPGSIAECDIARIALSRRSAFLREGFILLPLKETTLEDLWTKKEAEYKPLESEYSALYGSLGKKLISRFPQAIVSRESSIGAGIAAHWREGPDRDGIWTRVKKLVKPKEIERIRLIPDRIRDEGLAIKGPLLSDRIGVKSNINPIYFRHILQNHYFLNYIDEYNLNVISDLPFCRYNFDLESKQLYYNYKALRNALIPIKMWNIIKNASANSLIKIRSMLGYFNFRKMYFNIALDSKSPGHLMEVFSLGADLIRSVLTDTKLIDKYHNAKIIPANGFDLADEEIDAVDYRLKSIANSMEEGVTYSSPRAFDISYYSSDKRSDKGPMIIGKPLSEMVIGQGPNIAIFVALQMEREFLISRWSLQGAYPMPLWTGVLGSVNFLVFSPDEAGRVPAAVCTMDFLHNFYKDYNILPDILIVLGIAGGFENEGVDRGHVIVADSVADLATRKINEDTEGMIPEFRPKQHTTDKRISNFLKSGNFDKNSWEQLVIKDAEWPDGLRPAIKYGPIASLDEIVSSKEWIAALCKAWPKLLGVEMEAGGVCAAAAAFKLQVSVIRGVSDLADPLKSDTEWRRRAMKTIATIIEHIDYNVVCLK